MPLGRGPRSCPRSCPRSWPRSCPGRGPGRSAPGRGASDGRGAAGLGADAAGADSAGAEAAGTAGAAGAAGAAGPGRGAPPGRGPGAGADALPLPLPPEDEPPGRAPGRGPRDGPPLPPPFMESRSLRATGASTVEDADFTNSPSDSNCESTCLLVTPSSFASSCTRALPATDLLILEVGGMPATSCPTPARSSRVLHGWLMGVDLLPGSPTPTGVGACARVGRCRLRCEQCVQGTEIQRPRDAQRPGERRSALRAVQTVGVGMHPGTPPRLATPWVGHTGPVHGHHSQQLRHRPPRSAPHTGAHRSFDRWNLVVYRTGPGHV